MKNKKYKKKKFFTFTFCIQKGIYFAQKHKTQFALLHFQQSFVSVAGYLKQNNEH